jgi:hypothetical protein
MSDLFDGFTPIEEDDPFAGFTPVREAKRPLPEGVPESTAGAGRSAGVGGATAREMATGVRGVLADIRDNTAAREERMKPVLERTPPPELQRIAQDQALRAERERLSINEASPTTQARRAVEGALESRAKAPSLKAPDLATSLTMDLREATDNPIARGAASGFATLGKTGIGLTRLAADLVGADSVSDFARGASIGASQVQQGSTVDLKGIDKLGADVTASIMNSVPALMLGVVGGPALRTLALQSTLAEYNEGRDAGFDVGESLARASIMGAAEALGERFGFGEQVALLRNVAKGLPRGEMARLVGSMLAKEIPGEQLTTATQFLADKAGPAALNPNATLGDYLDQAADTLAVTIAQTGVMGGGPATIAESRGVLQRADRITAAPETQIASAIDGMNLPGVRNDAAGPVQDYGALMRAKGFTSEAPVAPRVESMPTRPLTPEELAVIAPPPAPKVEAAPQVEEVPAPAPQFGVAEDVDPATGLPTIRRGSLADRADELLRERTRVKQPDLAGAAGVAPAAPDVGGDQPGGGVGDLGPDAGQQRGVGQPAEALAAGGQADGPLAGIDKSDPALNFEVGVDPFKSAGAALAYAAQNRLSQRVRVTPSPSGKGFVLEPIDRPPSPQQAQEDQRELAALNTAVRGRGIVAGGESAQVRALPDAQTPKSFRGVQRVVEAAFGIRALPVTGLKGLGIQAGRRAYVDSKAFGSPDLVIGITGHEAFHWLERNDPAAHAKLSEAFGKQLKPKSLKRRVAAEQAAADAAGEGVKVNSGDALEEIFADINGSMWVDPDFWGRVYDIDQGSTFRRVAYQFMRAAAKVVRVATGSRFDVSQYVGDVSAVREVAAQVWSERAQSKGTKKTAAVSPVVRQSRLPGESDKDFAKRVVDKRPQPKSLAENPGAYFTRPDGTRDVPLTDLVSTKTEEENQQGGDNGPKRMEAAARGELSKRAPITVMPSKAKPGKFEVVDGNGTLTSAQNLGWKSLPVVVVDRTVGERAIKIDKAASAAEAYLPKKLVKEAVAEIEKFKDVPDDPAFLAVRAEVEAFVQPLLDRAAEVNDEYAGRVRALARSLDATPSIGPLKKIDRAAYKMWEDSFGRGLPMDESMSKDIVRASIIVDREADIPAAIAAVQGEFEVIPGRLKDRFKKPMDTGYRDVLMNVRLENGTIAELQIHIPEIYATKELGHLVYEGERQLPEGSAERKRLIAFQQRYYGAAYDLALRRIASPSASSAANSSGVAGAPDSTARPNPNGRPVSAYRNLASLVDPTTGTPSTSNNPQPGLAAADFQSNAIDDTSVGPTDGSILRQARSTSKDVGGYAVTKDEEGGIVVTGDQSEIRSLMPDGVRGRLVEGGVYFTPTQAPRVEAVLSGDEVAYGRAGRHGANPRYTSGARAGQYIGAPEAYNTPAKIPHLRRLFAQLAKEGEPGKMWYERSGEAVLAMVGHDREEARKFISLLAIYSPQAKVDANSTFALRAWAQYKAGQPVSVKTGKQDADATAVLYEGKAWGGEKTNNFFRNLMREVDAELGHKDQQGVTVDMWMMRAAGYNTDSPTAAAYAFVENETNRIAQDLGWEPQQVQAAIWVAMKARTENAGVKKATVEESIQKGFSRKEMGHKGTEVLKVLNEIEHRKIWLRRAMELQVQEQDTNGAKFDFADGVRRHMGQVSWEARPGRSTNVLPGVNDAPYHLQAEFQMAVAQAITGPNGIDLLAQKLGLLADGKVMAPGVWQSEVAAGMQSFMSMAPAKGDDGKKNVDPAQASLLNTYADILGLLLRQEGVGWHRPFYSSTKRDQNGVELRIGRPLTPVEAGVLWRAIDSEMRAAGVQDWESGAGMISSGEGMRVVNFGAMGDNGKFRAAIVRAAESIPGFDAIKVDFASDGNLVTNNWKENPDGQDYRSRISAAGRSDVLGWAESVLAPAVQAVFEDFSARYGWGAAGEPGKALRQSRDLAAGPAEPAVRPSDRGGAGVPGEVRDAVHYGNAPGLSLLSGRSYGSGLKGAERARLAEATDPRIKRRVYFYVPKSDGLMPLREAGVGPHRYETDLSNLADTDAAREHLDRIQAARKEPGPNGFESAVLDAGFDGYISRANGMAVVLNKDVPVRQAAEPARQAPPAAAPTTGRRALLSKEAAELEPRMADLRRVAPSAKLRMGNLTFASSEQAAVDAFLSGEYAGFADPFADNYSSLEGRKVSFDVLVEDTGQTATFTVDAAQYLRDLDQRLDVARRLADCVAR